MKLTKNLLIAAAMTGALAAIPLTSYAGDQQASPDVSAEKEGCNGKSSQTGMDKDNCKGHSRQGAEGSESTGKEKSACAGKDGCGGKDKGA